MHALSNSDQGKTYTIKWMFGLPEIIRQLRSCDIREGSTIEVIQKNRDWLIVKSHEHRFAMGNEIADHIQV